MIEPCVQTLAAFLALGQMLEQYSARNVSLNSKAHEAGDLL